MRTGTRIGRCILLASLSGASAFGHENPRWDTRFFLSGVQGEVRAIAAHGKELYVGGLLTSADDIAVTNVARWNGTNWSTLDGGVNGQVNAVAIDRNNIFVGGAFSHAGGVSASRIARWNPSLGGWAALGTGISGPRVTALAVDVNGALYAGGEFTNAGATAAANIAMWNGTNWSPLGSGLRNDPYPAWVLALVARDRDLYAGGFFTDAGGVNVNCIAKWNGAVWASVGSGVDDNNYVPQVAALALSGNDLYVGGAFASAGNTAAANVAKWDGAGWSALGDGIGRYFGEIPVIALAVSGTRLLAGGRLVSAGEAPANNLAIWDGNSWAEWAGGATGKIRAITPLATNAFVGGDFSPDNEPDTQAIAQWEGRWSKLSSRAGLGVSGEEVSAIARFGTNIYIGGTFGVCGATPAANVASWNGANWAGLGSGINGPVLALCAGTDRLFVGGQFSAAGAITASNLASWNGAQWAAVGSGVSSQVHALAMSGSTLIAGGSFTSAGNVVVNHVAQWNGNAWSTLGGGVNGPVYALAIQGSNVFVGGKFTSAGGVSASNVARWNGSQWFAVGGGVGGIVNPLVRVRPPPVSALAIRGAELYVGGDFAWAGGVAATNIAKWNGTQWSSLGAGIVGTSGFAPPPTVSAIVADSGGTVYIGGSFGTWGNIAHWTGSAWESLGDGVTHAGTSSASVSTLHLSSTGELLVGGRFAFAGGKPAANFATWSSPVLLAIRRSGEALEVFWDAATGLGYTLETTATLYPSNWTNASPAPVLRETNFIGTESAAGPAKFYRLRKD